MTSGKSKLLYDVSEKAPFLLAAGLAVTSSLKIFDIPIEHLDMEAASK